MRILIAPDKFKDALTAPEAAKAIEEGVRLASTTAQCTLLPLADGGEGTAELLTRICGGVTKKAIALNPVLEAIQCSWGFVEKDKKAFIELAEASGLRLLPEKLRNPLHTSTFGTGELIKAAISMGAKDLVIGLGGSATNDGGTGMAAALGYRFLDTRAKEIPKPTGKDLIRIRSIDSESIHPALKDFELKVKAACDVNNPLIGPKGATFTYAPQKGASGKMLPELEEGMENLAWVMQKDLGIKVESKEGSGAAGGTGAGVLVFLKGELCSGSDLILEYSGFHHKIKKADLLITGEGKIDDTSLQGKLLGKLLLTAKSYDVPVVAFCGSSHLSPKTIMPPGLKDVIEISSDEKDLKTALQNTHKNLRKAVFDYLSHLKG